jgi:hypothetical protein
MLLCIKELKACISLAPTGDSKQSENGGVQ